MKIALLADTHWLLMERATLHRLMIGLVDEQVRIVRVLPQSDPAADAMLSMTGEQLTFKPSRFAKWRDRQIEKLADTLEEQNVELVHALDGTLARAARRLGAAMEVPVLVSIWSTQEADLILDPSSSDGLSPVAYSAASVALCEYVRARVGDRVRVDLAAPGVFARTENTRALAMDRETSLGCSVIGTGQYDAHYAALLEGVARVKNRLDGAMFFFCGLGADQHRLWQQAEKLGLLEQIALSPAPSESYDALINTDVMIVPQPLGAVRTITLEAMAAGRPVIAAADPMVDHLIQSRTARLIDQPDPAAWASCLTDLITEPESFMLLGEAARKYVSEHHKASGFVAKIEEMYRRLTAPQTLPFEA